MTAYELGVDVSKWQTPEKVDWRKLRDESGIRFVIARYAYGNLIDTTFWKHGWFALLAGGIKIGAYQYLVPNQDAFQQANIVLGIAHQLQIPIVLDVEAKGLNSKQIDIWINTVLKTGITPMIYCSKSSWRECYGAGNHKWSNLPLWVANYTTAATPAMPDGWDKFEYWQFTSNGRLQGYTGAIDVNRKVIS